MKLVTKKKQGRLMILTDDLGNGKHLFRCLERANVVAGIDLG